MDASALLAYFFREPGGEKVEAILNSGEAVISSVNLTEVYGRLVGSGTFPENEVQEDLRGLAGLAEVVPFDAQLALEAGYFFTRRRPLNLSPGGWA